MNSFKKFLFNKDIYYNLGLCRILFYALALKDFWAGDWKIQYFYYYQQLPKELWTPAGVFHFYPKELIFSLTECYVILNILCVCLFFTMIGLATRFCALISFLLALLFLGYPNNFGTVYDSNNLFLVVLFVLIFSNMGSTLSVESYLKKKPKDQTKHQSNNQLWNQFLDLCYMKLIISLTCLFYFTSGIQKLRLSGLDWFLSDHLAISFMELGHPIGLYLPQFFVFCYLLAFLGLMVQCLSFIPIIYPRSLSLFLVLFFSFHIIIDISLGGHFNRHKLVLLFLFPWFYVLPQVSGHFKASFWPSFFKILSFKWNVKQKLSLALLFCISAFVFSFSIYAPYSYKHLYPFSTTTMFAYIDKEPIKRRRVFVVQADNKKRLLKEQEIHPLTFDKLYSKIKALEHTKTGKKQIEMIVRKLQQDQAQFKGGGGILKFIKAISLEYCYWETSKAYIARPYNPDRCEVTYKQSF